MHKKKKKIKNENILLNRLLSSTLVKTQIYEEPFHSLVWQTRRSFVNFRFQFLRVGEIFKGLPFKEAVIISESLFQVHQ